MQIETRLSDQVARYLDLGASQAKLTAQNMANVDTPGYRAMGIDFESEMRSAMAGVDRGLPAGAVHVVAGVTDWWRGRTATTSRWTGRA